MAMFRVGDKVTVVDKDIYGDYSYKSLSGKVHVISATGGIWVNFDNRYAGNKKDGTSKFREESLVLNRKKILNLIKQYNESNP